MADPRPLSPLADHPAEDGWGRGPSLTHDGLTITDAGGVVMWRTWSGDAAMGTALVEQDRTEYSTSPGEFTVISDRPPDGEVVDLTHVRSSIRISGRHARALVMRLSPLDVTPDMFPVGLAARTLVAGITCEIIHDADERYLVVASRSFARSLWSALAFAAEEWG